MTDVLDRLPEHRREALLWRYALELDYAGVADLVEEQAAEPCPCEHDDGRSYGVGQQAMLGDDGRWHLRDPGGVACVGDPVKAIVHEHACRWYLDSVSGATVIWTSRWPVDERLRFRSTTVRWRVRLTGEVLDPALVPRSQRCGLGEWPPVQTTVTALGRIRVRLLAELGALCHACGLRVAMMVDHDHFTGLVRGMLCLQCNTHIDKCPHASGCRWAVYLNEPPAGGLRLRHPKADGDRRRAQALARIEYLGFDPFPPRRR